MNRYRLTYSDGEQEWLDAEGPTQAVAARTRHALPIAITDETALKAWADGLGTRAGIHATPMLDRIDTLEEPELPAPLTWLERMNERRS